MILSLRSDLLQDKNATLKIFLQIDSFEGKPSGRIREGGDDVRAFCPMKYNQTMEMLLRAGREEFNMV